MKQISLSFTILFFFFSVKAQNNSSIKYAKIDPLVIHQKTFKWHNNWNIHISNAIDKFGKVLLDKNRLPKDQILELCPSFFESSDDDKKAFWALFFASIARYESNFDSTSRFKEPPPLDEWSEGLLQLSYGNEKAYKGCKLDAKKKNIFNSQVNLECGVIIMAKQLEKKGVIFTKQNYYWSVLTHKQVDIKTFFKKYSSQLNCIE